MKTVGLLFNFHVSFEASQGVTLKEFGMKKSALNLVEKGIPVNLSHPLFPGDRKNRRNSKNVQKNFNVIKNLTGSLEMAGHVQKSKF